MIQILHLDIFSNIKNFYSSQDIINYFKKIINYLLLKIKKRINYKNNFFTFLNIRLDLLYIN